MIRKASYKDAAAIVEIFNYYILNTHVNFEEEAFSPAEMWKKIESSINQFPWLVYEVEGEVIGYAYATKWRTRIGYRHSVESTVYIKNGNAKKGIGTKLYKELFSQLRKMDLHVIIAGICLPNEGSVALHEKFGFLKVAQFKEIGTKFGKWYDVGYWELII